MLKTRRDEFLEVKCPYCDLLVRRPQFKHHIAEHSEMNSVFTWHSLTQDDLQRHFSVNTSPEEKQRIMDEDIVNKPVLFTDPVYFNEMFSLHHRMIGPLFTHFTQKIEELEFLQKSFRPYFLIKSPSPIYGSVCCNWRCPDCSFKASCATFFGAVFLALCHLVKAKANHGSPLTSSVEQIVQAEWSSFNQTFNTNFQEEFLLSDYPVNIFDDFLPNIEDAELLESLFDSCLMEKNVFVFCACCLKQFDNSSAFVQHTSEEHKLTQELTFFSVPKDRVSDTTFNELTPHWFPLAFVINEKGLAQSIPSSLHWTCYECKVQMVETNRLLLLIKILLHFYFELFLPYKEALLSKRWPELLKFSKDLKQLLDYDVETMSFFSFDWLQLRSFVHKSEEAILLASVSKIKRRIAASQNHKVSVCLVCEEVFINPTQRQISSHQKSCETTSKQHESAHINTSLRHLFMEIHRSLSSKAIFVLDPNPNIRKDLLKGYVRDSERIDRYQREQRSKVAKVYEMRGGERKKSLPLKRKRVE